MKEAYRKLLADTAERYKTFLASRNPPLAAGWQYDLASTRLTKGANVVLGLNWGTGSAREPSEWTTAIPNGEMPEASWRDLTQSELGSFVRVKSILNQRSPNADIVLSNVCLFRTPFATDVSDADIDLSFPVVLAMLELIEPASIIFLTSRVFSGTEWRLRFFDRQEKNIDCAMRGRSFVFKAIKANMEVRGRTIPVCYVPHPNQPLPRAVRKAAWDFSDPGVQRS